MNSDPGQGSNHILDFFILLSVSKYRKRIFIDVLEMKESDVVVHSKDQDIQDWSNIALQIKEYYENYHGFVILHGTDTMAYLASALSFMFENLGKSVIFTGSQASLEIRIEMLITRFLKLKRQEHTKYKEIDFI